MTVRMVTANALRGGSVVYLRGDGTWSPRLEEGATVSDDADAESLMATAAGAVVDRQVVEPYLIELALTGDALVPVRTREVIRSQGPTVRTDLGIQASHGATRAA